MRVLFSVQRYGSEFAGGAEGACRGLAEAMAQRGHHVEAITSAARDYVTWRDHYAIGRDEINGVIVHRFPVRAERTSKQFDAMSARVFGHRAYPLVERDWVRVQGPDLPGAQEFIRRRSRDFDVASFYTYLYPTTALAIRAAAARLPTVIHPAAHQEPPLELQVFDEEFARVDGIAAHTPEEGDLIDRRFHHDAIVREIGAGIETHYEGGVGARFRNRFGIGEQPLFLFVGRVDVNKGTDELVRFFLQLHRTLPEIRLAVVGDRIQDLAEHPAVVFTGFVDEVTKHDAYEAANIFVMPSYQESFSIALCEAWIHGRPALVQGRCDVLAGQARRAKAGLPYHSYAEFEEAAKALMRNPPLREWLGTNGRAFVWENYTWPAIAARYEKFLLEVIDRRNHLQRSATK